MSGDAARSWHWPHLGLLAALPVIAWLALLGELAPAWTLAAWLLLNLAVLALAEQVRPYRAEWQATGRHLRRDGAVGGLNVVVDAGIGATLAALAVALQPGDCAWPLALQVAAGLAVAEFGSYWLHRWSHAGGWLWRVHALHHLPDRLNLANAVLAHPINAAYDKLVRVAPLLALGLSPEAVLVIAMFGLTQSLAVHANIAGTIGPLEWVIGSARLHRLHHSRRPEEAGNFGTALTLWDRVFGTFRGGAAPRAVGVYEPRLYPGEFELAKLLAWPAARIAARRFACC